MALCLAALSLAAPLLLAGCGNFFTCEGKADCPTTGTGTGTGSTDTDYVYVSNSSSGSTDLAGYDLSAGKLTAITGFPFSLGYIPVALNVAPSDSFLYVASIPGASNPGIYRYTIGTDGSLSGGGLLITAAVSSMDISPDGGFLFAMSTDGVTMTEYQVNTSTGALTLASTFVIGQGVTCAVLGTPGSQSCTVRAAPSGAFVVVALGTAGDAVFPYTSASGISSDYTLVPSGTTTASPSGDFSVALDGQNFAYIARTNALAVYSLDSTGTPTLRFSAPYASGTTPRSVVLSSNGGYVYTANEGTGTIAGYSIGSSGGLTAITNSPFTGPVSVSALGVDKSGGYLVAAGYNSSNGVQLFSMGTTGTLSLVDSAGSGAATTYPAVLALTH
jgi:6-phosphogluconolactonase (cycloisomerase 2 family)